MKRTNILIGVLFSVNLAVLAAEAPKAASTAPSQVIAVDSNAFYFSPGNWAGDAGRLGGKYRQTWCSGAYFRVSWESKSADSSVTLLMDTSGYPKKFSPPFIVGNVDGVWSNPFHSSSEEVTLKGPAKTGKHVLTVYVSRSQQAMRWGVKGKSGVNVLRIKGVKIAADAKPLAATVRKKWALIVGDSITEGIGVKDLGSYSTLVGQGLQELGYEYGISACGYSGWLCKGDRSGDVPGYYIITGSSGGKGGKYNQAASRWNKIDANTSLLDSGGHISASGKTSQEPSMIMINYGTNEALRMKDKGSDISVSMAQSLRALRKAAPNAQIHYLVPFGQYWAKDIHAVVKAYQAENPTDKRVSVIDLGQKTANSLLKHGYWGSLHPNNLACSVLATKILARITAK